VKHHLFDKRSLIIATMHEKERVIAPLFESEFGVVCSVLKNLNTDVLGTFSGEVERVDDPMATVRAKCLLALKQSGADLVVASEGSFGAHPEIFFAKANEEIVMLLDLKNGLEIVGKTLTTETNFDGKEVGSWKELQDFAESVQFPSHGLILRDKQNGISNLVKGITDWHTLESNFENFISQYGSAWAETDMRAMYNPTRMQAIRLATEQLIENIKSLCPVCETPGFTVRETRSGLPCSLCSSPTRSIKSLQYNCSYCGFTEERARQDGKTSEDPMYCDICNP
jgi:hypothetical protein